MFTLTSPSHSEPSHHHKATQITETDQLAEQLEQICQETDQKLANITMAQANIQQQMHALTGSLRPLQSD